MAHPLVLLESGAYYASVEFRFANKLRYAVSPESGSYRQDPLLARAAQSSTVIWYDIYLEDHVVHTVQIHKLINLLVESSALSLKFADVHNSAIVKLLAVGAVISDVTVYWIKNGIPNKNSDSFNNHCVSKYTRE